MTGEPGSAVRIDGSTLRAFSARGTRSVVGGWFDSFTDADLESLAARLDPVARGAGEALRDERDHSAWLLLDGEIRATYQAADRSTVDLGVVGPGSMFGDLSLLLDVSEPLALVAVSPCRLARLDHATFWRWTESGDPAAVQFHRMLARALARRLRVANQRFVELQSQAPTSIL